MNVEGSYVKKKYENQKVDMKNWMKLISPDLSISTRILERVERLHVYSDICRIDSHRYD